MKYEVRVFLSNRESPKAYATVSIDGQYLINGVKIFNSKDGSGVWVGMPGRKDKTGKFKAIVFFMSRELKNEFDRAVIEAYNKAIAQYQQVPTDKYTQNQ